MRDVAATIITGKKPPLARWEAMEHLRVRYALPEIINTADALPGQLTM